MNSTKVKIASWEELVDAHQALSQKAKWVFRGQHSPRHELQTSLERAAKDFDINGNGIPRIEENLLRTFKRRSHQYLKTLPTETDTLEWWSLMQHHGAPTRLLDWTYSFYVAVFFAVERVEAGAAVWALNFNWCQETAESLFPKRTLKFAQDDPYMQASGYINEIFRQNRRRLVYAVNPFRLNERLIIQQGLFLCAGDVRCPFTENFEEMEKHRGKEPHLYFFEMADDVTLRGSILRRLVDMNMTRATLFPGLDGFAESLRTLLAVPVTLSPRLFGNTRKP